MAMKPKKRKIVSSKHLATDSGWALSEVEFSLTVVNNAFQHWIVRCAAAAGPKDLSAMDVLGLHNVNLRDTEKRRVDIGFVLNIEDDHTVNYALKKLMKLGLVEGEKRGKEVFYAATARGRAFCEDYRDIRQQCLISTLKTLDSEDEALSSVAETLRALSGMYDQASRAAASL